MGTVYRETHSENPEEIRHKIKTQSIARDAEVFSDTSDPQWENEKEYDTDGDGTITRREFGLLYLADILIELN